MVQPPRCGVVAYGALDAIPGDGQVFVAGPGSLIVQPEPGPPAAHVCTV